MFTGKENVCIIDINVMHTNDLKSAPIDRNWWAELI